MSSGKAPRQANTPPAAAPARADARRNREKLLTTARVAFAEADATAGAVALEVIARGAGVGIGTLYRHFPTREALVEAVYAAELDDVTGCVPALLAQYPPDRALRAWLDRYAAFIAAKRGMMDILRAGWASGTIATPTTRERITAVIGDILVEGTRAGLFRADVAPEDVTAMIFGIFLATSSNGSREQTGRLLDLVIDALRPGRATGG
ncbi:TetR/AcrR family transcriptional regulator [Nocardia callitridis]|uniref:TetR family transcriptional regulator n=1 Tax=Nocardia callitridis TaxID=648753 RepID=A0ABP9L077_9NOCA